MSWKLENEVRKARRGGPIKDLDTNAYLILLAIAEECRDHNRQGHISHTVLQYEIGRNDRKTVSRAIKRLIDRGLIRRIKGGYSSHGTARATLYELCQMPPDAWGTQEPHAQADAGGTQEPHASGDVPGAFSNVHGAFEGYARGTMDAPLPSSYPDISPINTNPVAPYEGDDQQPKDDWVREPPDDYPPDSNPPEALPPSHGEGGDEEDPDDWESRLRNGHASDLFGVKTRKTEAPALALAAVPAVVDVETVAEEPRPQCTTPSCGRVATDDPKFFKYQICGKCAAYADLNKDLERLPVLRGGAA